MCLGVVINSAVTARRADEFSLNAAVDGLPHNANLYLWHKRQDPTCQLNNCPVARDLRRYNNRHDAVLKEIVVAITPKLVPSTTLAVDIGDGYMFPQHITPTDLRPDLVWWDDTSSTCRSFPVSALLTTPCVSSTSGSSPCCLLDVRLVLWGLGEAIFANNSLLSACVMSDTYMYPCS